MGIIELIRWGILIVSIALAWIFGRAFVLPHVMTFPELMPVGFWKPLYNTVFHFVLGLMHWIICALIIFYIIYCAIRKFAPKYILFFRFRDRLLDLPPLRELRESGIVALFDAIVDTWRSGAPLLTKLQMIVTALARFVITVVKNFIYMFRRLFNFGGIQIPTINTCFFKEDKPAPPPPPPPKQTTYDGGLSIDRKDMPPPHPDNDIRIYPIETRDEALAAKEDRDPIMTDTDMEPSALNISEDLTPSENIYIDKQYRQCIQESYIQVTPEMDKWEKLKVKVKNTNAQIGCGAKRNLDAARIISIKFAQN